MKVKDLKELLSKRNNEEYIWIENPEYASYDSLEEKHIKFTYDNKEPEW